ncbi:hypothetical protein [Bdellovibrio sp. HCB-110]|uniref:hypothetical protein n=1 Tax=Bdellovibrio sp. HCB-110 TaxID=3391182 RepID=UPI0039B60A2C
MKTFLFVLMTSLIGASSLANAKSIDIARCDSDCWVDRGDLSGVGRKCFMFYISQNGANNFSARMMGGYDDAGNPNIYDLGSVVKGQDSSNGVIWTVQSSDAVKSIRFVSDSSLKNGACVVTDIYNRQYRGISVSPR